MKAINRYSVGLILFMLVFTSAKAQFQIRENDLNGEILKEKTIYIKLNELSVKQIKSFKEQKTICKSTSKRHGSAGIHD